MIYAIKNKEYEFYCYDNMNYNMYHSVDIKQLCNVNDKTDIVFFNNKKDAEDFIKNNNLSGTIEEFDCDCSSGMRGKLYVRNLERMIQKNKGCSLKESFEKFLKKQNQGKFLFSDLKKIINSMSEEELDQPVNIEVMGPMTYEQHNIVFTNGREMNISGKTVKSTSDCFVLAKPSNNLTIN